MIQRDAEHLRPGKKLNPHAHEISQWRPPVPSLFTCIRKRRGIYILRDCHIPVFRVLKFSRFLKRRPKAGNFSDLTERIGRIEATKATVPLLEIVPAKSFTGTTR